MSFAEENWAIMGALGKRKAEMEAGDWMTLCALIISSTNQIYNAAYTCAPVLYRYRPIGWRVGQSCCVPDARVLLALLHRVVNFCPHGPYFCYRLAK